MPIFFRDAMQVAGFVGALVLVTSFALVLSRRIRFNSLNYLLCNLVGSGLLLANAVDERDIAFTLVNALWFAISAIDIARHQWV